MDALVIAEKETTLEEDTPCDICDFWRVCG